MIYFLLEKKQMNWKFIKKAEDLAELYRLWLENPVDRIIVKEVQVEVKDKDCTKKSYT